MSIKGGGASGVGCSKTTSSSLENYWSATLPSVLFLSELIIFLLVFLFILLGHKLWSGHQFEGFIGVLNGKQDKQK